MYVRSLPASNSHVSTHTFLPCRLVGGGELKPANGYPFLLETANCTNQVYVNKTSIHGKYVMEAHGATEASAVKVGYTATGPQGIFLTTKKAVAAEGTMA